MRKIIPIAVVLALSYTPVCAAESAEAEVRKVIQQFQEGLAEHNLAKLEPLVASDMVAFENGSRNDGWEDLRDHHLAPEFQRPAPSMQWEFVKVVATPQMAWGYTKTDLTVTRKNGEKIDLLLWSVYVLEKRSKDWKIVVLDWSLKVPRPTRPK